MGLQDLFGGATATVNSTPVLSPQCFSVDLFPREMLREYGKQEDPFAKTIDDSASLLLKYKRDLEDAVRQVYGVIVNSEHEFEVKQTKLSKHKHIEYTLECGIVKIFYSLTQFVDESSLKNGIDQLGMFSVEGPELDLQKVSRLLQILMDKSFVLGRNNYWPDTRTPSWSVSLQQGPDWKMLDSGNGLLQRLCLNPFEAAEIQVRVERRYIGRHYVDYRKSVTPAQPN